MPIEWTDEQIRRAIKAGLPYSKVSESAKTIMRKSLSSLAPDIEAHIAAEVEARLTDASFWLIEMLHNDAPLPRYWHPVDGYVWDVLKASRFCRKEDAEAVIKATQGLSARATEHRFFEARAALATQGGGE